MMAENRLIGGYPVIGIRPTIDGRRGPLKVRESLASVLATHAQKGLPGILSGLKSGVRRRGGNHPSYGAGYL